MRCNDCKYRNVCDDAQPDTVSFGQCSLQKYANSVNGQWTGKLSLAAGWSDAKQHFKTLEEQDDKQ